MKMPQGNSKTTPRGAVPPSLRERLGLPGYTADTLYALAFNSLTAGQVRRAEKFFLLHCILEPGAAHAFLGYGLCLDQRRQLESAGRALGLAIRIAPKWATPRFHLARVRLAQGKFAEAGTALAAFHALCDENVPAQLIADAARMQQFIDAGTAKPLAKELAPANAEEV